MNEAVNALEHHATSKDGYKLYENHGGRNMSYYKKKHNGNTDVEKFTYKRSNPNKYNKVVGRLWDPDILNTIDHKSVKRKVARVYNPNLVIIQQRFKKWPWGRWKYFYALATKVEISENKTIIAMTSANINDHHPSDKEYKNTIIENANLFKTDIDSEEDIRKGTLEKAFVNIAGYLIEKKDNQVEIIYIESIDEHGSI
ncbi:fam-a protein [Plasmodium vinckei]|uniref:Fam-a protein n=1 Tax=Plasmodium vinckei TaxID=5860 RepID=A0A6V7TD02_PLAVN|nr:fam-a protein [Plasmodium vinckei]